MDLKQNSDRSGRLQNQLEDALTGCQALLKQKEKLSTRLKVLKESVQKYGSVLKQLESLEALKHDANEIELRLASLNHERRSLPDQFENTSGQLVTKFSCLDHQVMIVLGVSSKRIIFVRQLDGHPEKSVSSRR